MNLIASLVVGIFAFIIFGFVLGYYVFGRGGVTAWAYSHLHKRYERLVEELSQERITRHELTNELERYYGERCERLVSKNRRLRGVINRDRNIYTTRLEKFNELVQANITELEARVAEIKPDGFINSGDVFDIKTTGATMNTTTKAAQARLREMQANGGIYASPVSNTLLSDPEQGFAGLNVVEAEARILADVAANPDRYINADNMRAKDALDRFSSCSAPLDVRSSKMPSFDETLQTQYDSAYYADGTPKHFSGAPLDAGDDSRAQ